MRERLAVVGPTLRGRSVCIGIRADGTGLNNRSPSIRWMLPGCGSQQPPLVGPPLVGIEYLAHDQFIQHQLAVELEGVVGPGGHPSKRRANEGIVCRSQGVLGGTKGYHRQRVHGLKSGCVAAVVGQPCHRAKQRACPSRGNFHVNGVIRQPTAPFVDVSARAELAGSRKVGRTAHRAVLGSPNHVHIVNAFGIQHDPRERERCCLSVQPK